jgi:ribosomal protein S18 acetylase RimI-like enzyme
VRKESAPVPVAPGVTGHPLDSPTWAALDGPHRRFGEALGGAARYRPAVAPFGALRDGPDSADPQQWADLAALIGPGAVVVLSGAEPAPPPDWTVTDRVPGLQLTGSAVVPAPDQGADPKAVQLGDDDVPEMLDLVRRTRPGPFRSETHRLGGYLGVRDDAGALIGMAGRRLHAPGWIEISAVCTDPAHRSRGLAARLVRAVVAGIRDAGETPFLHVAATNTGAIRLYRALGFTVRREVVFSGVRTPGVTEPEPDPGP